MVTAARILYAKYWKQEKLPETDEWVDKMIYMMEMDRITKSLKQQNDEIYYIEWGKFKVYLEQGWDVKGLIWAFVC